MRADSGGLHRMASRVGLLGLRPARSTGRAGAGRASGQHCAGVSARRVAHLRERCTYPLAGFDHEPGLLFVFSQAAAVGPTDALDQLGQRPGLFGVEFDVYDDVFHGVAPVRPALGERRWLRPTQRRAQPGQGRGLPRPKGSGLDAASTALRWAGQWRELVKGDATQYRSFEMYLQATPPFCNGLRPLFKPFAMGCVPIPFT